MAAATKPRKSRAKPAEARERPTASRTAARSAAQRAREQARTPKGATGKARELVKRVGRPSKLNQDVIYAIGDMVLAGNYREVAAQASGVSRATLNNWIARGQEYESAEADQGELQLDAESALYVEFLYVLKTCEAAAECGLLANAAEAKPGWQAHMTILERRWPARWRRRDELDLSGSVGHTVKLDPEREREELQAFGLPAALAVAAGPDAVEAPADA